MTMTHKTSIPIKTANAQRIADALAQINGRAQTHTASATDVLRASRQAEERLAALGVLARDRAGAVCDYVSGRDVLLNYKHDRRLNTVTMRRSGKGWTVIEIKLWNAAPTAKTGVTLTLTAAQDGRAVAKLREAYKLAAAPEPMPACSTLHDYRSGEPVRAATPVEAALSIAAAQHDGGRGVIPVDGRSCYVL